MLIDDLNDTVLVPHTQPFRTGERVINQSARGRDTQHIRHGADAHPAISSELVPIAIE